MTLATNARHEAPAWSTRIVLALRDIKLAHTVFAMPFAVLGAFLARPEGSAASTFAGQLTLVVVCMVFARTWAMLVNRLADRVFDAANPRTERRIFASGQLTARDGAAIAGMSAGGFIACCALFLVLFGNPWPLILCVPVLGWIALYSYTKRFTALCHVFLGGALAASPLAAAIAIDPSSLLRTPALWWISAMVVCWVAGFDVIYALQDIAFDRSTKLRSIPARLGASRALWVSRVMHAAALVCLALAWRTEPRFDALLGLGVILTAWLLVLEHAILIIRGERGLSMAFFTVNGVVSCVLGVLGVADLVF